MFFTVSKEIRQFCDDMIANPDDWEPGPYRFCKKSNREISIWIANGVLFVDLCDAGVLTLAEKFYITKSIKKTLCKKALQAIKKVDE